ncbi:MAG: type II toxin-antitoxin system VapC family toxin [Bryobacteraceae bacterium]
MSVYVLDASVAAKWFLSAEDTLTLEAQRLFDGYARGRIHLIVPDLFWPELGNVLCKAVRGGRVSQASAILAIKSLRDSKIPTHSSAALLEDAFEIAVTFQRSIYDCIYVALAINSNSPFVTADERLANALPNSFPVRWLGLL